MIFEGEIVWQAKINEGRPRLHVTLLDIAKARDKYLEDTEKVFAKYTLDGETVSWINNNKENKNDFLSLIFVWPPRNSSRSLSRT